MKEYDKLFMNIEHDINMRKKQFNALMKRYFKDEINGSFLIKMKENFLAKYSGQINQYYPPIIAEQLATQIEDMYFDICRHIVGVHRSNMVFLTKEEQRKKEDSADYQEVLLCRVLNNVKLRNY